MLLSLLVNIYSLHHLILYIIYLRLNHLKILCHLFLNTQNLNILILNVIMSNLYLYPTSTSSSKKNPNDQIITSNTLSPHPHAYSMAYSIYSPPTLYNLVYYY